MIKILVYIFKIIAVIQNIHKLHAIVQYFPHIQHTSIHSTVNYNIFSQEYILYLPEGSPKRILSKYLLKRQTNLKISIISNSKSNIFNVQKYLIVLFWARKWLIKWNHIDI